MGLGLLDLCQKYFGTSDFYEVLDIPKTSSDKQVKKAYHKLSLKVHPDRVGESIKYEATEKFKVLGKIHMILSDKEKRKAYDDCGYFDHDIDDFVKSNWRDYWHSLFKEITVQDINNCEKDYKGSAVEVRDLKQAYLDGKGDIDYILQVVPFTNCDEEPRLHSIIQNLLEKGEVPKFKQFFEEDEKKARKRKRKWAREAEEVQDLDKILKLGEKGRKNSSDDLTLAIVHKNKSRASTSDRFFDNLMKKYSQEAKVSKHKKN